MTNRIYPSEFEFISMPQRVMIIGCGGAGKSTLSRKLGELTKLPVIHLDREFWKPNWVEPDKGEWAQKVESLAKEEKWILEGNYSGTFSIRLARVDLVVWLDMPMPLCLWRVIKRSILNYGKVRPEMGEGCPDRISLQFLHYIMTFPWRGRRRIIKKLGASPFNFEVVQLKNKAEVRRFLFDCTNL